MGGRDSEHGLRPYPSDSATKQKKTPRHPLCPLSPARTPVMGRGVLPSREEGSVPGGGRERRREDKVPRVGLSPRGRVCVCVCRPEWEVRTRRRSRCESRRAPKSYCAGRTGLFRYRWSHNRLREETSTFLSSLQSCPGSMGILSRTYGWEGRGTRVSGSHPSGLFYLRLPL